MNRSSLPVSVNTMKKWYESDDKVLQCTLPFQRHSGMWSPILKSNLVWSMLADSYIPPIVLLKDKRGEDSKGKDIFGYQVLEGQQRLITTLFPFLNDELELHGATEPVEVDGFTCFFFIFCIPVINKIMSVTFDIGIINFFIIAIYNLYAYISF